MEENKKENRKGTTVVPNKTPRKKNIEMKITIITNNI